LYNPETGVYGPAFNFPLGVRLKRDVLEATKDKFDDCLEIYRMVD
jgi:hypothetical protein